MIQNVEFVDCKTKYVVGTAKANEQHAQSINFTVLQDLPSVVVSLLYIIKFLKTLHSDRKVLEGFVNFCR